MRILCVIPHYFGHGPAHYGSTDATQRLGRLSALRSCIASLHQQFGRRQGLLLDGGAARDVNQALGCDLDVVVCVTGTNHLLQELALPEGSFTTREVAADNPLYLGYGCYDVFRERFSAYDWYCYLEDDIVIGDPLFFCKLQSFYTAVEDARYLLQPNRYELGSGGGLLKAYVDGPLWKDSAEFLAGLRLPECRDEVVIPFVGHDFRMTPAVNPHSGCYFLSPAHLQHMLEQPWYGQRVVGYAGPLESAATQYIMTLFHVFKPAEECASFLEVHHYFQKHVDGNQSHAAKTDVVDKSTISLWSEDLRKPDRLETHKSWFRTDTIDYWRHERMYEGVFKCLAHTKDAKWLTVGDGRYGLDAIRMKQHGFRDVTATDLDVSLLNLSYASGLLNKISSENAAHLSFEDNSFDFVLCKESYHHFRQPMLALYEMIRVARKAVVLVEPQDPHCDFPVFDDEPLAIYEDEGNYVYSLSRRELEKTALGLGLPAVAFKNFCDFFHVGMESKTADESSQEFVDLINAVNVQEERCARNEAKFTMLMGVVFIEPPEIECVHVFQKHGWLVRLLPHANPAS